MSSRENAFINLSDMDEPQMTDRSHSCSRERKRWRERETDRKARAYGRFITDAHRTTPVSGAGPTNTATSQRNLTLGLKLWEFKHRLRGEVGRVYVGDSDGEFLFPHAQKLLLALFHLISAFFVSFNVFKRQVDSVENHEKKEHRVPVDFSSGKQWKIITCLLC